MKTASGSVLAGFVALLCLAGASAAFAAEETMVADQKGSIFVADISDPYKIVDGAVLDYYSEIVRDGARQYASGYRLMDKENAELMLKDFGLNVKDCMTSGKDDCVVTYGERLQADIVVSGQVLKMSDGTMRVVLKIHDVVKREPLKTVMRPASDVAAMERILIEAAPELYMPLFRPDAVRHEVKLPPPDPNAGRGHLYVFSIPEGADITLNDEPTGRKAPFLFEDLAVGYYKVELDSAEGVTREVKKVVPNNITRIEIKMPNNKQGSLLLETNPPGLGVILDGKNIGVSPQFVPALAAGIHKVNVEGKYQGKSYLLREDATVNIEAARRNRFTINAEEQGGLNKEKARKFKDQLDVRRKRVSFQGRLSGGLDLNRAKYGVAGLVQIGLGTGRWFDIHTGVGFPGYAWVTDFEVNLYPRGRFVPTLAVRVGLGFAPGERYYSLELDAGVEFWILDWLAAFVKIGVGGGWNTTTDRSDVIVPAWLGLEMRY